MIFSKTKKAIKRLNEEKIKLEKIQNVLQANTWKASLKASLIVYLGKDSTIVSRLDNLFFTKKAPSGTSYMGGAKSENIYDETKKNNFEDLIDNSIEYIQSHGLYKNPMKKNFLSDYSNVEILTGLFVVGGIVFSAGIYKDKLDNERQIEKMEIEKSSFQNKYTSVIKTNEKLKFENDSLKKHNKNSH